MDEQFPLGEGGDFGGEEVVGLGEVEVACVGYQGCVRVEEAEGAAADEGFGAGLRAGVGKGGGGGGECDAGICGCGGVFTGTWGGGVVLVGAG